MTTRGHIKPCVQRCPEQPNEFPEDTIVSSLLSDLICSRDHVRDHCFLSTFAGRRMKQTLLTDDGVIPGHLLDPHSSYISSSNDPFSYSLPIRAAPRRHNLAHSRPQPTQGVAGAGSSLLLLIFFF